MIKYAYLGRTAFLSLFFLMVFQICYSLAPISLTFAIKSGHKQAMILFSIGYIVLNFLPYIFAYFSYLFKAIWQAEASYKIAQTIRQNCAGKYYLLNNYQFENKYQALITNNSQDIVKSTIVYIYGFMSNLASSVFTVLFISLFVMPGLIWAYALSCIACYAVIRITQKKPREAGGKNATNEKRLYSQAGRLVDSK